MSDGLTVRGVSVRRGGTTILDGVHLQVPRGGLCGLIGPSGAGKSTLIKVMLGLLAPAKGTVTLDGAPLSEAGPVGYVPQSDALHATLTVDATLRYAAELRLHDQPAAARAARVDAVIAQVGLAERRRVRVQALSGGQRKRVSVALELLAEPDVLILDEPTSGLDPGLEARTMDLLAAVAAQGRVVLVATHAMQSLDRCSTLVVLVGGRIAYAGPPGGAPQWFGVSHLAAIFDALPSHPPAAWAARWAGR
jgi:ABC-type multidrug transport system ATPase subunit